MTTNQEHSPEIIEHHYRPWAPATNTTPNNTNKKDTSRGTLKRKMIYQESTTSDTSDTESGEITDTNPLQRCIRKRPRVQSPRSPTPIPIWANPPTLIPEATTSHHQAAIAQQLRKQREEADKAIQNHYKKPIILTSEEQQILMNHYKNIPTTQPEQPTQEIIWNQYPFYTQAQLNAFQPYMWNERVFRPFKVMMDKQKLAVALRFLSYVPLVPPTKRIPDYVFEHSRKMGIGSTIQEIALFFKKDINAIQTASLTLRRSIRYSEYELDKIEQQRNTAVQRIMRNYVNH
jgi:hypothetical protein